MAPGFHVVWRPYLFYPEKGGLRLKGFRKEGDIMMEISGEIKFKHAKLVVNDVNFSWPNKDSKRQK